MQNIGIKRDIVQSRHVGERKSKAFTRPHVRENTVRQKAFCSTALILSSIHKQELNHRTSEAMAAQNETTFPQVNISNFDTRKQDVSAQLGHAAREIGFFYVTGSAQDNRQ